MVIDVHTHIFPAVDGLNADGKTVGRGYGRISIGDKTIQLLPPMCQQTIHTPEMLIANLDWVGVNRAILLQGPFYGECNDYVHEAILRYPNRLSGAQYVDPWESDSQRLFEINLAKGGFTVVKLECSDETGYCGYHHGARLDSAELSWLWTRIEQNHLTLTLDLGRPGDQSYQTGAVYKLAVQYPQMRIVIAHLGQPRSEIERDPVLWGMWLQQLDLGRLPNVWFDNAALPAYYEHEGYPFPGAARMIRIAIERIGPSKVMWGTDAPGLLSVITYKQLLQLGNLHLQFLSTSEQAQVLGANAQIVYG